MLTHLFAKVYLFTPAIGELTDDRHRGERMRGRIAHAPRRLINSQGRRQERSSRSHFSKVERETPSSSAAFRCVSSPTSTRALTDS